jgi:hypothetical protein
LAYQRPSLEIMKDNLGFPGHRFITGYKLENDFVHPDYVAKPWYDESGDLNAKLTSDGVDEHLSYDVSELRYAGNGLVPDVSSFGSHEDRDFFVTHKIYVASASHPAIALDDTSVAVGSEESIFSVDIGLAPKNPEVAKRIFPDQWVTTGKEGEYNSAKGFASKNFISRCAAIIPTFPNPGSP